MGCITGVVPVAMISGIENGMATAISNMHSRIDIILDNPLTLRAIITWDINLSLGQGRILTCSNHFPLRFFALGSRFNLRR